MGKQVLGSKRGDSCPGLGTSGTLASVTPAWIRALPVWLPLLALSLAVTVNYQPALGPVGAVLDAAIDLVGAGLVAGAVWALCGFRPRYRSLAAVIWIVGTLGAAAISWIGLQHWA
jgi:hypothetical protein